MPHRFPALIADPPRGEGRLWLTGGRLFDGTGGPVRTEVVPLTTTVRRTRAATTRRMRMAALVLVAAFALSGVTRFAVSRIDAHGIGGRSCPA